MFANEHSAQGGRYGKKRQPLLRKYVARSAVKPRLRTGFLLLVARARQISKHAIGYQAKLVVVVEDDAAMTGDAEILEQQIAGEHVARRQIAQRVAAVDAG